MHHTDGRCSEEGFDCVETCDCEDVGGIAESGHESSAFEMSQLVECQHITKPGMFLAFVQPFFCFAQGMNSSTHSQTRSSLTDINSDSNSNTNSKHPVRQQHPFFMCS